MIASFSAQPHETQVDEASNAAVDTRNLVNDRDGVFSHGANLKEVCIGFSSKNLRSLHRTYTHSHTVDLTEHI